jgi:hypothetical protein
MERRHFELIAGCVSRSRMAKSLTGNAKERNAALSGIQLVATDLAATLAHTNENFDRARFMKACGFE